LAEPDLKIDLVPDVTIQCVSPHHINAVWRSIVDGMIEVLDHADNEHGPQYVYQQLASGNYLLWLGLVEGEYGGFAISEIVQTETRIWVNIPYAYTVPEKAKLVDFREMFFPLIEDYAKSLNFSGVRFLTARSGFLKIAPKLGYKPRFVEYVKEFEK
jgi:hypothetical protein